MKSIEATGPLCPDCLRPIAFLLLDGRAIAVEGKVAASGSSLLLERHSCQPAERRAPPQADRPGPIPQAARVTLGFGARGPLSVKNRDAMRWVLETLESGPRPLRELNREGDAAGFTRSNLYRALKRTGAERYSGPDGRPWFRFAVPADATS